MDKVERRQNLKLFREGAVDLLVSTDLASRGLDVDHVGRVINYHLPQQMENYLHRVGRTARAGRPGLVVNFVTERDAPLVSQLESVRALTTSQNHPPRRSPSRLQPLRNRIRRH
jgi:superfamily II DNA/RNA helicase